MKLFLALAVRPFLAVFAVAGAAGSDNAFVQTNLVANSAAFHPTIIDPSMIDAWGIALRPPGAGGHIWVNNAKTGTSVEYIGDVAGIALHQDGLKSVSLDTPRFTDHGCSFVTGIVYNAASDIAGQPVEFPVSGPASDLTGETGREIPGGTTGSAKFVFVSEDGAVNAWRANTKVSMTGCPVIVDYSKTAPHFPYATNCVFSGAAITTLAAKTEAFVRVGGNHVFATDFRNNVIEVFDNQWRDVTPTFRFKAAPGAGIMRVFNITDLGGHLYVAYAVFNPAGDEGMEELDGPGYGHVAEYNEDGTLVREFQDSGVLNAPWGMAIAPAGFGRFGGDLLVGNFGDGTIAAFEPATGKFIDYLKDPAGKAISIDGVWGLTFGNGVSLGESHALYFTAGPNKEFDGLFGKLTY